jgi:hypothetical protein
MHPLTSHQALDFDNNAVIYGYLLCGMGHRQVQRALVLGVLSDKCRAGLLQSAYQTPSCTAYQVEYVSISDHLALFDDPLFSARFG